MDLFLSLEKGMLNSIFNIKESKKNLKKTPYPLTWIFFRAQVRCMLNDLFMFRESKKNLKKTLGVYLCHGW